MFGPKREAAREGWRKLHNEQFHELNPSPYIIRVVKSRRMGWVFWQNGEE
jgi:hypothetical protein